MFVNSVINKEISMVENNCFLADCLQSIVSIQSWNFYLLKELWRNMILMLCLMVLLLSTVKASKSRLGVVLDDK